MLLLAVFVPAVLASSLHRHHHDAEEEPFECVDCHHHSGHLTSGAHSIDDCVLCHFLALPYIAAISFSVLPLVRRLTALYGRPQQSVCTGRLRHQRSRAPPVCFA